MTSLLTNPSALTALQSLRATQLSLNVAQKQISTGLKISSAADNASTYSISQTIKSDQGVFSTLADSLSVSSSLLNVAAASVTNAISVVNQIKNGIAQAEQPGADTAKILTNLQQLGKQLSTIVSSSSVNGVNLLDGSQGATLALIASYSDGKGAAASSISTIDVALTGLIANATTGTTGILDTAQATGSAGATDLTNFTAADLAAGTVADTLSNADKAIADLTTYSSTLGASQSRVDAQTTFVKTLNDALTSGVSALVDADLNETSTRLQALQTQQQLGVQSLSIANQNAQIILKLFQ
jgi:flagellin